MVHIRWTTAATVALSVNKYFHSVS